MSIAQLDENGVPKCTCNGDHWVVSYYADQSSQQAEDYGVQINHGKKVQVSGKLLTIQYFDTQELMNDAISYAGLDIPGLE